MIESLHNFDVPKTFADMGPHIGQTILAGTRQRAYSTTDKNHRQHHHGHAGQHNERQLGVGHKQQHQAADKHQDVTQCDGDGRADNGL